MQSQLLNNIESKKRAELILALEQQEVSDPFTATILGSILLAHVVGAVGVAVASAAVSYGIGRLTAGKNPTQQVGLMKGSVQLQNSSQGSFIPEIYGGAPIVTLEPGAEPTWDTTTHVSTASGGAVHKNSGTDRVYNAAAALGPIAAGDNAFIKFTADVLDRGTVAVGFSTTDSPFPVSPTFITDPPRAPFSMNPPLIEAGIQIGRVASGLDASNNVLYDNAFSPIVSGQINAAIGIWTSTDQWHIEKRDGTYHIYRNYGEISRFTPPNASSSVYIVVVIWSIGSGIDSSFVKVGGDIGLPPSAGSGGCKVPGIVKWAKSPKKNSQIITQRAPGGKGHPSTSVEQIYYTIDMELLFCRGPVNLIREYGNTDILLNFDPQLIGATGVYDPNESETVAYNPTNPPTALTGDFSSYSRSNSGLIEDPTDPGGGTGSIQHGASQTTVFTGSQTQLQFPTEEADIDGKFGEDSTSADRGHAKIGHTALNLSRWQGIPPNILAVWQHQTLKALSDIYESFCLRIVDENQEPLFDAVDDMDWSSLDPVNVRGMLIDGRRFSPAEIMDNQEVQDVYNYFTTEGDGKMLGFVNGDEPEVTIPDFKFGWVDGANDLPEIWAALSITEADETKLARQCDLKYINPGNDWDPDTQSAMRKVTLGNTLESLQVALTLNPDEARSAMDRRLMRSYIEGKSVKFTLSWEYMYLFPGYKIITTSTTSGFTYVLKLTAKNGGIGIQDCEAVALEVSAFNQDSLGAKPPGYNPGQVVPAVTILTAMDLPTWRTDGPNTSFGMDFAGTPRETSVLSWNGFALLIKRGTQWTPLSIFNAPAIMGVVVSSTALSLDPSETDLTGEIMVDLYGTRAALSSITEADMIAGANRACVADMVVGFADAVRVDDGAPNRWLLSTLRSGLNNTADAIPSDPDDLIGRNFCLLDGTVRFVELDPFLDKDNPIHLRAVSLGSSLADTAEVIALATGQSLRGPALLDFNCHFDKTNKDALLEIEGTSALGESQQESYEIEISIPANGDFSSFRGPVLIYPNKEQQSVPWNIAPFYVGATVIGIDPGGVDFFISGGVGTTNYTILALTGASAQGGILFEFQMPLGGFMPSAVGLVGNVSLLWTRTIFIDISSFTPNYIVYADGVSVSTPNPGVRYYILIREDGIAEFGINYSGKSTVPLVVSNKIIDLDTPFYPSIQEIGDDFPTVTGVNLGISQATMVRPNPEWRYIKSAQLSDNIVIPPTIKARARQKSFSSYGLAGPWLEKEFIR